MLSVQLLAINAVPCVCTYKWIQLGHIRSGEVPTGRITVLWTRPPVLHHAVLLGTPRHVHMLWQYRRSEDDQVSRVPEKIIYK